MRRALVARVRRAVIAPLLRVVPGPLCSLEGFRLFMKPFILHEPLERGDSFDVLLDTNDSDDSGFLSWISASFRGFLFSLHRIFHVQDPHVDMSFRPSSVAV